MAPTKSLYKVMCSGLSSNFDRGYRLLNRELLTVIGDLFSFWLVITFSGWWPLNSQMSAIAF